MLSCYYGTDTYRLRDAVSDAVTTAQKQQAAVTIIDFTEPTAPEQLERELKYPSFFGERKYIVARNAACPAFANLVHPDAAAIPEDISVVAVQETARKGSVPAILADLHPHEVREFSLLEGKALMAWLKEKCGAMRVTLEPEAADELIRRVGSDTGRLAVELEKLAAFTHPHTVGIPAVRLLTPDRKEEDEWELSNAIASLEKRRIMTALWRKVREGAPEQLLIGACAAGIRNLLLVKGAAAGGSTGSGIAKMTGLHPFVVSKTLRGAVAADGGRLTAVYRALTRLDRDSKDGRSDAIDGLFSALLTL